MVKKVVLLFLFLLFYNSSIAQEQKDLWWLQTSENKKYEKIYKYAFCDVSDGVLKEQIIEFIKKYLINTNKKKEEVAIELSSIFTEKNDEKKYRITYISNYYNFIPYFKINQIAKVSGKIIFIQDKNLNDFRIKKEVLFGLLRKRHPKITRRNNISYSKDSTFTENWTTEHEIPNYILTIKNNKLIKKEIVYE
ncbi:hypothetical protein JL193_09530 [Polaribacter batillariae]|uniref:Uncharacterized protein n=1 Tax=Polaribacter batillariae TaxID=2808900 RepID=A0ABX7SQA7_9FLAO|nr:hypothetical protein [Polaribacter batillariae]QTD36400.1 hypothetical protein JL193_09530 [Polaribacter batillariae]